MGRWPPTPHDLHGRSGPTSAFVWLVVGGALPRRTLPFEAAVHERPLLAGLSRSMSGLVQHTPEAMQVRKILPEETEQARLLLAANDWGPRVEDPGLFSELVARSHVALVAVDESEVVGFLRALSDGIFNGYISMVVVAREYRGRGIGTALVQQAMGDNDRMTWVLRAGRTGVSAFYEKLGFSQSEVSMERPGRRR